MNKFYYGEDIMTVQTALEIASGRSIGLLSDKIQGIIHQSSQIVDRVSKGAEAVYGINTGFGPLCTTKISSDQTLLLQQNILMSHAVGVGDNIDKHLAKLMLILKVHSLAYGFSGIRLETLKRIIWHIDQDVIPTVPSQGSVGASGDLAPLSHLFLPLIGLGHVFCQGSIISTHDFLERENMAPIGLGPKEGLALINGTQFITAHTIEVVNRLNNLIDHADMIGAMMIEGLLGSIRPFMPQLHQLRPYKGCIQSAQNVFQLIEGSPLLASHHNCDRVQDPYSLRCIPQVHGAARNTLMHLEELLYIEMNSVTDNPVIINEEMIISGGNFHGEPLAMALDYAGLAASEISNISDRRIYLSLEGKVERVPKLLMTNTGINSGFMILQYTTAALASENKGLCFPSSADSIPTSLGQEDHVSMGSIGGRKALQIISNTEKVLALERICAAQAIDFHRPLRSTELIMRIHDRVREEIEYVEKDQLFYPFIDKAISLIKSGDLIALASFKNQKVCTN